MHLAHLWVPRAPVVTHNRQVTLIPARSFHDGQSPTSHEKQGGCSFHAKHPNTLLACKKRSLVLWLSFWLPSINTQLGSTTTCALPSKQHFADKPDMHQCHTLTIYDGENIHQKTRQPKHICLHDAAISDIRSSPSDGPKVDATLFQVTVANNALCKS